MTRSRLFIRISLDSSHPNRKAQGRGTQTQEACHGVLHLSMPSFWLKWSEVPEVTEREWRANMEEVFHLD